MDLQELAAMQVVLNIKSIRLLKIIFRISTACLLLFIKHLGKFATEFTEKTEREKEL
jgi:hypothetical protein